MQDTYCFLPEQEIRKPIPGYPHYEVNQYGQVYSTDRRVKSRYGCTQLKKGKKLSYVIAHNGYVCFTIKENNKFYPRKAHRLVLAAFLGPLPEGMQVNHKDCDKTNNHFSNLEYVTPKQNMVHASRTSRHPTRPVLVYLKKQPLKIFESIADAAFFLGIDSKALRIKIVNNRPCGDITAKFF